MYVDHHQLTGEVQITYTFSHTNHSLGLEECKYIPLPFSIQKEIQEKFMQGVTLERSWMVKYYTCTLVVTITEALKYNLTPLDDTSGMHTC